MGQVGKNTTYGVEFVGHATKGFTVASLVFTHGDTGPKIQLAQVRTTHTAITRPIASALIFGHLKQEDATTPNGPPQKATITTNTKTPLSPSTTTRHTAPLSWNNTRSVAQPHAASRAKLKEALCQIP